MIKNIVKKFLPKSFLFFYHKGLALLASFLYGQPSNKLIVIGVTGTAGKSTTVYLVGKMLEKCGWRVGWTSSISFKDATGEKINKEKMTMPGRFFLQRFLKNLVKSNYQAVIIETSSEGILQSRHLGINYDVAVFTNLSPEHIEAHGGFENYKKTKAKLFIHLKKQRNKIIAGKKIDKTIIANLDDENINYFLEFPADKKIGYTQLDSSLQIHPDYLNKVKIMKAETTGESRFKINGLEFNLAFPGKFNIYNALAAISVSQWFEIPLKQAKKSLESIISISGRMEEVVSHPFKIIVDYAHTPTELENVYLTLANQHELSTNNTSNIGEISDQIREHSRLICVLGSCGGGRDKWKRPKLGKLAAHYCNQIILTNEDPYDDDPNQILSEIKSGIINSQFSISNLYEILDRKEAIKKALSLAKENDTVIITGKGCEQWMCIDKNKKIAWDDREIAREEFKKLKITSAP